MAVSIGLVGWCCVVIVSVPLLFLAHPKYWRRLWKCCLNAKCKKQLRKNSSPAQETTPSEEQANAAYVDAPGRFVGRFVGRITEELQNRFPPNSEGGWVLSYRYTYVGGWWAQFDLADLKFVWFAISSALMDLEGTVGPEVWRLALCRGPFLVFLVTKILRNQENLLFRLLLVKMCFSRFKATLLIHIMDFDALVTWKKKKASQTIRVPSLNSNPGLIKTPFSLVSFITWTDKMNHLG